MSSVSCCEHILDSGFGCGSPAVSDQKYCFFHLRLHQRPTRREDGTVYFILRDLTCVESIQIAISNVLHALNDGLIDSKKANSLYRGLGLALSALRLKASEEKRKSKESNSRFPSFAHFVYNGNVNEPECSTGIPAGAEAPITNPVSATTNSAQNPVILRRSEAEPKDLCIPADTTNPAQADPPILSNSRVKALKRIIRQGPRHPLFHSSARRLEAHIARVAEAS
jgi:hypothetical protein